MLKAFLRRLPGYAAGFFMILVTLFWVYWSIGEMYHEGWWGVGYNRLAYLIPGTVCLLLTLVAFRWPQVGGWLIVIIGIGFTIFFMDPKWENGRFTINREISGFLISGSLVFIGILFLIEAHFKKRWPVPHITTLPWWRRNLRYLFVLVPSLLIFIGFSVFYLPILVRRIDDGNRDAQLIAGNGVTLIWAPEGPGWNWQQAWGGYPSWQHIALYGSAPIGMDDKPGYGSQIGVFANQAQMDSLNVCLYLGDNGLTLMNQPQYIWRMSTVDEYVRSLTRHGENAGCRWQGEENGQVACDILPDKESPLWNPQLAPIYYWAANEFNDRQGFFVSFNGYVNTTTKTSGNPRHSYRCVRDP
ncbi:MAG: hypothetical protein GY943_28610 [Chloroflexi bacterium]|nr:hypothetical protein [Chloroflexota bacterium]